MSIGLSTYAFLWRSSDRVEDPFTLRDILEDTHSSGCTVLQICDYPPLDELSIDGLFLGRFAHDARAISGILDDISFLTGTDPADSPRRPRSSR